jgi:hypothetical protein
MAAEQELLGAAAEKSEVTMRLKASQGELQERQLVPGPFRCNKDSLDLNCAMGAEAAMAPSTMCGNFILCARSGESQIMDQYHKIAQ